MNRMRRFARLIAILFLSGIAACGGGSSPVSSVADDSADTPGATDATANAQDPLTNVPYSVVSTAVPSSACANGGATIALQATFVASNPDVGDRFGAAVAMSDNIIAIGASGEDSRTSGLDGDQLDNGASNAGAVYLWECEDGVWRQTHYLKPDGTAKDDYFGDAVALSGETLIVGAKGRTVNGKSYAGAAFVYRKAGAGWLQTATLTEASLPANSLFGHSVAVSGDIVAVGAPGANDNAGRIFFYRRSGDAWTLEDAVSGTAGAYLGRRLALSGDTAVSNSVGAALVYQRAAKDDGTFGWTRRAALAGRQLSLGRQSSVVFGTDANVAIAADRLVVTSPSATVLSFANAGVACVFKRAGGEWNADGYCFAPDPASHDLRDMFFGQSGAAFLDNGRLVVTADADSSAGVTGHGSVFVFAQSGGEWMAEQNILSPAGPRPFINFGFSGIAASGNRFIVSEQLGTATKDTQGAAYLFGSQ